MNGIAVSIARGPVNPHNTYIQLKGGSVYGYPKSLSEDAQSALKEAIVKAKGRVKLNNWVKIR